MLPLFPQTNISYPVVRRPYFSTIVQTASSGLETRIGNYTYPLSEWDLVFEYLPANLLNQVWQTLYGFYVSQFGKFGSFLYDDPTDNNTSPDPTNPTPSVLIADGVNATYQIGRCLPYGSNQAFEPLFDLNGAATVTPTPTSISPNGLMSWGGPLPAGTQIKMDFKYYWRVRFADDDLEFSNFAQYFWESKKVTLRQVRAYTPF